MDSRLLWGGYTPLPGGSQPPLPEYYGCYTPISGRFRRDPRLQVFFSFEEMPVPLVEMKILISRNLADSRKKDKNNKVSTRHAHFCSAPHSKFAQFSERNFALFWKNVEISGCNRLQNFAEFRFESNIFSSRFSEFLLELLLRETHGKSI